jgi:hypothetical protein
MVRNFKILISSDLGATNAPGVSANADKAAEGLIGVRSQYHSTGNPSMVKHRMAAAYMYYDLVSFQLDFYRSWIE